MFIKKRKGDDARKQSLGDSAAKRIAAIILTAQGLFADFLNSKTNTISIKAKKWSLAVFCIVLCTLSVWVLVEALTSNQEEIKPTQLSAPKYYNRAGLENIEPSLTKKDMKRVSRFKKQMDSLRLSPSGKIVYDTILKSRPGLMDSIKEMEEFYYSNSK